MTLEEVSEAVEVALQECMAIQDMEEDGNDLALVTFTETLVWEHLLIPCSMMKMVRCG